MGAREFDEWAEYYASEPWGAYRDNLHAGIIASVIVNSQPGRKRKPMAPGDFVLKTKQSKRAEDTRRSLNYLRAIGKKRGD